MIDFKMLEKLLDLLNASDAQSIEVTKRWWSTSIRVSKLPGPPTAGPVTYQVANAPPHPPAAVAAADAATDETHARADDHVEITSPMVGTFYTRADPDTAPYVEPGGRVEKGEVVCIIEAMKIMNPLEAEISGVVVERLVDDAQPVEFGQVLFRVNPHG